MTTHDDRSGSQATTVRRRRWAPWILGPAVLGAVIGGALAARETPVYQSEMLIGLVPQRIPESLVPSPVSITFDDRLRMISRQILSRTRLERIIKEFDLYAEERRHMILEEIIEKMRDNVEMTTEVIGPREAVAYRIKFIGTEPGTVMKVAERLAGLFIKEHSSDNAVLAESTQNFLAANLRDTRRRLLERQTQLRAAREKRQPEAETLAIEYEVLQTAFKDLSAKIEESRLAADSERAGIGEQLRVIDGARLPERPIAPDWRKYVGIGTGAGASIGVLALLLGPVRRRPTRQAEASTSGDSPSSSD